MPIQTLPHDFGRAAPAAEALVVDYRIESTCLNSRIELSQNVFSFLLEGTKELVTPERAVHIDNRQFLLIRAGNCLMSEQLAPSRTYRSLLFFFPDALAEHLLRQHVSPPAPALAAAAPAAEGIAVLPYDAYLTHFVQSKLVLHQGPAAVRQRLLPAKLEEILLYLLEQQGTGFSAAAAAGGAGPQQRLRQVVEANALAGTKSFAVIMYDPLRAHRPPPPSWPPSCRPTPASSRPASRPRGPSRAPPALACPASAAPARPKALSAVPITLDTTFTA